MKKLTELPEWQALYRHQQEVALYSMREWFDKEPERFSRFSLQVSEILLDYSRNRITNDTIQQLCHLAKAMALPRKIENLFKGEPVNQTEKRPALHTALRDKKHTPLLVNGQNITSRITATQKKMADCVEKIRSGEWKGVTGKSIRHIVNVGIGGSYLGPMMAIHALADFATQELDCHFVSTVDAALIQDVLKQIDPESTLFIISSKSFSTIETATNAQTAYAWMERQLGKEVLSKHFVAVTAAPQKAKQFGIPEDHIFELWEWVGGRYSIWSAIGLPIALMLGNKHFAELLEGAYEMDQHFRQADLAHNMPVLLGLLSIWYTHFFGTHAQAIAPYSHRLRYLVSYFQQLEMESNGKCVTQAGMPVTYPTSPVIFGEEGCNGQHAYHQLLHQGQQIVPVDFILVAQENKTEDRIHHDILLASGLSQAQALMRGKTYEEAREEELALNKTQEEADYLARHREIPGNKPSNVIFLNRITPYNLGALLALYEHKTFVQGAILDINSFDQWGVELGKQLLPHILHRLQGEKQQPLDCATEGLIAHYFSLGSKQ